MVKALTTQRTSPAAARADRSVGMIETAVRRHVRIELELESDIQPASGYATILSLAGPVLTLQLEHGHSRGRFLESTGTLRARFTIDGRCFQFDAVPIENPITANDDLLTVRRPAALRSVDRRRVARRQLHSSTEVGIRLDGADTSVRGGMLNLSDFGLACRIAAKDHNEFSIGVEVRASFSLLGEPTPFDLHARVVNLTPASDGKWIAGIEFDRTRNDPSDVERLRRTLGAPSEETASKLQQEASA